MEKIDIVYERRMSGSYMKIRTDADGGFDEQILIRKRIPGLLSMEKCYMDGSTQFWYDISGKQSLDMFCRVREVGQAFLEQLVHSICEELSVLEQHLIDTNCLCVAPELVYVSIQTGELVFTAIPGKKENLADGFRELVEYLLTRVDHTDTKGVRMAYDIYEKTLDEGYSIADIQDSLIQARIAEEGENTGEPATDRQWESEMKQDTPAEMGSVSCVNYGMPKEQPKRWTERLPEAVTRILAGWKEKLCRRLPFRNEGKENRIFEWGKRAEEENAWRMVYPDDEYQEETHSQIHPTVCLNDCREQPEGVLLYEGYENFVNIRIEKKALQIGYSKESDVIIEKNTISRYHARIVCENREFFVEDLNSTNGTFVNEKALAYKEKRKLETNDIIRFADVKYRFV